MAGLSASRSRALLALFVVSSPALAQQSPDALPLIVVTATRSPLEITRSGSAVSVIESADIERTGAKGFADVLRAVPGLDVSERGGAGGVSYATLRGSNSGQTLVLVDGVRVGDPAATDGAVDLGAIAVADIARIEVLRGPQSALYGSDAMGGVINIITRRGAREPRRSVSLEGGGYGTFRARGSMSGATDTVSYAFSVDTLHSDNFARYVDRQRLRAGTWPTPPKSDPVDRIGANGRVTWRLGENAEIDVGLTGHFNRLTFDNPFAFVPANIYDRFNHSRQWTGSAFARAAIDTLDGRLKHQLTLFTGTVDRLSSQTESCPDFFSNCVSKFRGSRYGAEYQGDLKLGAYGLLIFGGRTETESALTSQILPPGYVGPAFNGIDARQTTNAIFALHQYRFGENVDVSLGGRIDSVASGSTFPTWRATAAWRLPDTGTKFRASAGTGAKIPSLYQRFSEYGSPTLAPERNTGFDAGVDQSLFGGRLTFSATGFYTKYRDLIDFNLVPTCTSAQIFGCYYNVGRATTYGAEFAADAVVVPDAWRARAAYTHLVARDEINKTRLLQRPRHKGVFSVLYTGMPRLELEGRLTLVSAKLDFGFPPVKLAPWARLDMFATWKLNDTFSLFARAENVTNAHYEEVFNYAVAGRSFFAGVKATW